MFSCWSQLVLCHFLNACIPLCAALFFYRVEWAGISLFEKIGLIVWLASINILVSSRRCKVCFTCLNIGFISCYLYSLGTLYLPILKSGPLCSSNRIDYSMDWDSRVADRGCSFSLRPHLPRFITFAVVVLIAARNTAGLIRIGAIGVAVLTIYNVLNIETGRTGFLQVISVSFIFLMLSLPNTSSCFSSRRGSYFGRRVCISQSI